VVGKRKGQKATVDAVDTGAGTVDVAGVQVRTPLGEEALAWWAWPLRDSNASPCGRGVLP
jgi:hypothetical protein